MKKQRTSYQLLKNYVLMLFLLPVFSLLLIVGIASLDSKDNIYTHNMAERLMKDDYRSLDTKNIVDQGGGVQVVNLNFEIIYSEGENLLGRKDRFTPGEFSRYLMNGFTKKAIITVDYNDKEKFWLVVTLPNRMRVTGTFRVNINLLGYTLFALAYIGVMLVLAMLYSKMTAVRFITPLRQLSAALKKVRTGEYSARVPISSNKEFSELELSFNHMAEQIEKQITIIEQSERNRKSLMLDISHDLKNPLASVTGYAELLLSTCERPGTDQWSFAKIIYENGIRANDLIMDLFELSRLDSPEFQLDLAEDDFTEYIRGEMIRMLPELEAAGLKPEFDIPEKEIRCRFDKKRMNRVLSNLLYNAIAYQEKGSRFEVRVEELPEAVRFTLINDNGMSASEDDVSQLLEPSIRDDQADSLNPGGSGLGLAIVKKIVTAHGGRVRLETNRNTFEIRIELPKM